MSSPDIVIGIDLGTTNSRVAIYQNGKVKILSNPEGNKTTPSVVAFKGFDRLIGNNAENQSGMNPKNTIFNCKRLIGRRPDDLELQADIKKMPFLVSTESYPVVEVEFEGGAQKFTFEEICAMILQKMKDTAERCLRQEVKKAVITVPAYFNDRQRQATKDAAKIAGLDVLRLMNETTAAALTFGLKQKVSRKQKILIFDMGGGTTDVSIVSISPDSVYKVKSTSGDTHLGGTDFDQTLVDHFMKEFYLKYNVNLADNKRALRRLLTACETTKRRLSTIFETRIEVASLYDNIDFTSTINRDAFENMCKDLFDRVLEPVKTALREAKVQKNQIDEIILVGGSSRIPKVQQLLQSFFNGKELNFTVNPDEAVVHGAARQAESNFLEKFAIRDLTPRRLTAFVNGKKYDLLASNTPVPFIIETDIIGNDGNSLVVDVFEEEQDCNVPLGKFSTTVFSQYGRKKVDVVFVIDENGISAVEAVDKKSMELVSEKWLLNETQISKMTDKVKSYEKKEALELERLEARHKLELYIHEINEFIESNDDYLSRADNQKITDEMKKVQEFLVEENATTEKLSNEYKNMKKIWEPIKSSAVSQKNNHAHETFAQSSPVVLVQDTRVHQLTSAMPVLKEEARYTNGQIYPDSKTQQPSLGYNAPRRDSSNRVSVQTRSQNQVEALWKRDEARKALNEYLNKIQNFLSVNHHLSTSSNFKLLEKDWKNEEDWIYANYDSATHNAFEKRLLSFKSKCEKTIDKLKKQYPPNPSYG